MFQYLTNKMRVRYITILSICWFIQVFFLQITVAAEQEKADPELSLEEMRIAAYTKEFAERFGFPAPAPGTEPSGGLQAIEFAIEKGPAWAPLYFCKFYLYLDSNLPIKYPEEGVAGDKYMLISATHFFSRSIEQWRKWQLRDRRYLSELDGKYNRKANLASMNYIPGKQGAIADLSYQEFHRDFLPGLAYVKLSFTPSSLIISKPRKNIGIWLQKESKTDYRSRIHVDPNDFLKFAIPDHIFQKAREWGLKAEDADAGLLQILREQRNKRSKK